MRKLQERGLIYLYTLAYQIQGNPAIYLQTHYRISENVNYAVTLGMN